MLSNTELCSLRKGVLLKRDKITSRYIMCGWNSFVKIDEYRIPNHTNHTAFDCFRGTNLT